MFLFALVTTLFITSCGQKQKGSNTLIRPVKTAQISSQSVIRKDFSGIVEAVEYVRLAFRVSGQIISLPVVEGQRVKKGQLIAAIDPRDISLQYAADKAAYETAAAQVERNKRLLGRQAISVQEYEISVANYQKAKSTYELSGNNMRDTRLTAPFEGSIEKRLVENYQRVNAGEGVVQLVNTQKLRIKFTVPDDYLYLLRAKDVKFKVVFDSYPAEAFDARLEEYLDISTAGTGIPVTITIDDPHFDRTRYDVKPGFTCKIKLASDVAPFLEEKLMNVPLSAVFGDSENRKTYVWVVEGNKVSRREVTPLFPNNLCIHHAAGSHLIATITLHFGQETDTYSVYQRSAYLLSRRHPSFGRGSSIVESAYTVYLHSTSLPHEIAQYTPQVLHHRIRVTTGHGRNERQFICHFTGSNRLAPGY